MIEIEKIYNMLNNTDDTEAKLIQESTVIEVDLINELKTTAEWFKEIEELQKIS